MRAWPSAGIVVAIVVAGCGSVPTDVTNPSSAVHISILGSPLAITAPESAKVDVAFAASFNSYSGGCDQAADVLQETLAQGTTITLIPLNQRAPRDAGHVCATYIANLPRSAEVTFLAVGTDTLRVEGFLQAPDGSLRLGSIEKVIRVTP